MKVEASVDFASPCSFSCCVCAKCNTRVAFARVALLLRMLHCFCACYVCACYVAFASVAFARVPLRVLRLWVLHEGMLLLNRCIQEPGAGDDGPTSVVLDFLKWRFNVAK